MTSEVYNTQQHHRETKTMKQTLSWAQKNERSCQGYLQSRLQVGTRTLQLTALQQPYYDVTCTQHVRDHQKLKTIPLHTSTKANKWVAIKNTDIEIQHDKTAVDPLEKNQTAHHNDQRAVYKRVTQSHYQYIQATMQYGTHEITEQSLQLNIRRDQ